MFDLIIRNTNLPDGRKGIDIGITGGKIRAIDRSIAAQAGEEIDATGRLASPPFVDPHFHMDATLSLGLPRMNVSGTLLEGIAVGRIAPDCNQGGAGRSCAALLRSGGDAGPAVHPQPCRYQ
jgi:cytosine deaminase